MPKVEMICLANSNKMGGRCIAGLGTNGEGWIRPVARDTEHGQLLHRHYSLGRSHEPEILDLVEIELVRSSPTPGRPENWEIGDRPWKLIERPARPDLCPVLTAAVVSGPILLGSDRGSVESGSAAALKSSLALVNTRQVQFYAKDDIYGKRQARAVFALRGQGYDLPITDPMWKHRIVRAHSQESGITRAQPDIGIPDGSDVIFTISLSEVFAGSCFKLVAGIIVLP